MDMMSYSKKYSRLLLWGIFSFLVLTGNLLSVIGYSSLINISPVFKLGIGVILLFFCFFIYVHKMTQSRETYIHCNSNNVICKYDHQGRISNY